MKPILEGFIKAGTLVRVAEDQLRLGGRLGRVTEDSSPETVVLVDFKEGKTEQLHRDVLTVELDCDDPKWSGAKAALKVRWSNPVLAAQMKASSPANPEWRKRTTAKTKDGWTPEKRQTFSDVVRKQRSKYPPEKVEEVLQLLRSGQYSRGHIV